MDDLDLLVELHRTTARQGPGGEAETCLAITLSGLSDRQDLKIADIGCGNGAASITLAKTLAAEVTAVDLMPAFLQELDARVMAEGLSGQITSLEAAMDALPFQPSSLDAIWSEGAIYNIGFGAGIRRWRPYLKPGGILAVSDLTWLTKARPAELQEHWAGEYPEVDTAAARIALLEAEGYAPIGYFTLPEHCWLENYYAPLQRRFGAFLEAQANRPAAQAVVAAVQLEISLCRRYSAYVSYGFYLARKLSD